MEEQIYRQPRRNGKTWILVVAAVAVLLLCGVAFVLTANRLSLSVELNGEPEMMLEYGGHFQDPGAQLRVRGSLLWKDGMSPQDASVGVQGKVDEGKPGKYILTYEADYRGMHARGAAHCTHCGHGMPGNHSDPRHGRDAASRHALPGGGLQGHRQL